MQVDKVTENDGLNMAYVIQLLAAGHQLRKGLSQAGIKFEGHAFANEDPAATWLNNLAKDMATALTPKEQPVEEKRNVGRSAKPSPAKKSKAKPSKRK
jgi:hypothetical protein